MYETTKLDNQLRIVTSAIPHASSVSIMILVGAGSRYENSEMAGLSHFLEHLPFKGSKNWPSARLISETIEGVGGIMNASTDREMTVFWCKVSTLHFKQAFAVLVDMILNPILDPQDMEKERDVIQEELRMTNDYPTQRVDLLIDELLWPNQAMGRDVGGTLESVSYISLEAVKDYMESQYNPANTVISVAGNITHREVTDLIESATSDWHPKESLPWENVKDGPGGCEVKLENRKTDQSHICIGLPGIPLDDPDRYALSLLNGIFGEGMSSRLFLNLREEQGLAYDVSSSLGHFRDCGSLVVYCGVEPQKTRTTISAIMHEFYGITQGITEFELIKAKEYAKGRLLLRMEDSRSVAAWMGTQELLLNKISTVEEVIQEIDSVTEEDIERVSNRVISSENIKTAIVGPHRNCKRIPELLKF